MSYRLCSLAPATVPPSARRCGCTTLVEPFAKSILLVAVNVRW